MPAGADRLEGSVERQGARGDERAVLAQAVPDHHVGPYPVLPQQRGERSVRCEDGRLGDLRLEQLLLHLRKCGGIVPAEDVRGQRPAQQGRHDPVGGVERARHDRLGRAQLLEHVDVLRALPGVEERDRGRRSATQEDSLRPQRLPRSGVA